MKRLIVNADDYGFTNGVSRGIRDAHLKGIVTSTTAMMNMPDIGKALQTCKYMCPDLGVGVHLVLTRGVPVLPVEEVPSLVNDEGLMYRADVCHDTVLLYDSAEVEAEWRAQIEKFCALYGQAPDHLDSHHHISYEHSQLFSIMLKFAREYQCAIRAVPPCSPLFGNIVDVPAPDRTIIDFFEKDDQAVSVEALCNIIETLPDGVSELMCHPAYVVETLINTSSYGDARAHELSVLTDECVRKSLHINSIKLVSFAGVVNIP